MSTDWTTVTVSDLVKDGVIARPLDGNHGGIHPKGDDFVSDGIPFIMASDLIDERVDTKGCKFIAREQADGLRNGFSVKDDVLLSHKATIGRTAIVGDIDTDYIMLTPQVTYYRVIDKSRLNNRFLKYYFDSAPFQSLFAAWAGGGSTRAYLGITGQLKLPITIPPINVQHFIARSLGRLDDKIELNRRMNDVLEGMARAIFKAWFIDFEPVKAKAASATRFPGMPQPVFDQLPSQLVPSELGEIPEEWEVLPLYDTAMFVNGASFKSEHFCSPSEGLPVIKIAELKYGITGQTKYSARDLDENRRIDTGDLLYSWSGSPETSLAVFVWARGQGLLNQHIFKVITATEPQKHFAYYLLDNLRNTLIQIARNKQTTGLGHVTVADMKRLHVCRPPEALLNVADEIIGPLFNQSFANDCESLVLTSLRDTLLPKLISGEISVPPTIGSGDGR